MYILKLNKHLHICLFIIYFTTSVRLALSVNPKFEACKPQTCGNGPHISYPFWLSHQQESFCGYQNFRITCREKNPVLRISNDDYIIKEILYSNNSFLVANGAVYSEKCPVPHHNFTLDETPFNFASDHIEFSFFYNCTSKPTEYVYPFPVDCYSNKSHHSFAVFHKEALQHANFSFDSCQSSVKMPAEMADGVEFNSLLEMNYTEILKMGFLLNWTGHSCSSCKKSGGRCGFNENEFVCFCGDRPHMRTCDDVNSVWTIPFYNISFTIRFQNPPHKGLAFASARHVFPRFSCRIPNILS